MSMWLNSVKRLAVCATLGVGLLSGQAFAQFTSDKVSLKAHIPLATFGATAGNDCWGYVSPSGREYALISLNNKVCFVEVTDPANPVWFAEIPHLSSSWGDLKIYRDHAYAVTEAFGSGVQVIDMSDIDNHNVTLVQTIASPGRSHNVYIDTDAGFLYCVGSRNGTGTTMCFDLSTPGAPVQVGPASMTPVYQHDIIVRTFTSGPYAGKQIAYGSSEGRGVDIYDFTDKNNPVLISRTAYPFVSYCHQAWLSADSKYLYVDDELDEYYNGIPHRTLIFDVSDITAPVLVGTAATGMTHIDHNQYWHKGFLFQADYTTGLRIFDTMDDPTAPTQIGWFDTYPENDGVSFNGAWSNYPFFPSGTVIVSDINRGLFVLDVSEATTKSRAANAFQIVTGSLQAGNAGSLGSSDDSSMQIKAKNKVKSNEFHVNAVFEGVSPWSTALKIEFNLETRSTKGSLTQYVDLFDWTTGTYTQVDQRTASLSDTTVTITAVSPNRFIQNGTNLVRARIRVKDPSAGTVGGGPSNIRIIPAPILKPGNRWDIWDIFGQIIPPGGGGGAGGGGASGGANFSTYVDLVSWKITP